MASTITPTDIIEHFDGIIKRHNFFLKDALFFGYALSNYHLDIEISVDNRFTVEVYIRMGKELAGLDSLFEFMFPGADLDEEKRLVMKNIEIDGIIAYQLRCYAELIQQRMPFILDPTWEIPKKYLRRGVLYREFNIIVREKYLHIKELHFPPGRLDIDVAIKDLQKKGVEIPADILEILDKYEQEQ